MVITNKDPIFIDLFCGRQWQKENFSNQNRYLPYIYWLLMWSASDFFELDIEKCNCPCYC